MNMCSTKMVEKTYGVDQLARRMLENLDRIGYDIDRLKPADLISFDELHVMGREATIALGTLARLSPSMQVLDVGCGVGGPARTLATHYGCQVMGVDLSKEFASTSDVLSKRLGLADSVAFQCADAMYLPFTNNTFDVAFLFHITMNIVDKKALLSELHRVLKHGGRLALWEICQGSNRELIYPVAWAEDASFSHLVTHNEMLNLIETSDYKLIHAEDASEEALSWIKARLQPSGAPKRSSPLPDLDLVLSDFRRKRTNVSHNLAQGGITILRAVAGKA